MVNLPVDVMPWPATLASWRYFTHDMGHYSPLAACKRREMRKAPILFHYTNLAEGVTERDWKRMFMCRWRDGESLPECSQITRDKFERTMPQAYCCWAIISPVRNTMYTRNLLSGAP